MPAPSAFRTNSSDESFDFFVVGNSLTVHSACDYWWGEWGMAASAPGNDFVHIVEAHLAERHSTVNAAALNFAAWETMSYDRTELVPQLDGYLNPSVDAVVVQLGENISDSVTLDGDFSYLLGHIARQCPAAKIIVVGSFWERAAVERIKRRVAEQHGAVYIPLERVWNDASYQSGLGAQVLGADGAVHTVGHAGVALHPGDKGMRLIADALIAALD